MKRIISFVTACLICITHMPYIAASERQTDVFFYCSFDGKLSIPVRNGGGTVEDVDIGGNISRHYIGEKDTSFNTQSGIVCNGVAYTDNYVAEATINIKKLSGNAFIALFDSKSAKNTAGKWRLGTKISVGNDGNVYAALGSEKKKIEAFTGNNLIKYSAAYDETNGTCTVYINETKLFSASPYDGSGKIYGSAHHRYFGIDMTNYGGKGEVEFYLDDVSIYNGKALLTKEEIVSVPERDSVMENEYDAKFYLRGADAFSLYSDYWFHDGERVKYMSDSEKPILHDGTLYMPVSLALKAGYKTDSVTKKVLKGREYILPDSSGKTLTKDKRGFFILTNGEFRYTDGENFTDLYEAADVVYRYLQFDNPNGEKVISDMKSNGKYGVHPRILYTSENLDYLKSKFNAGAEKIERKAISEGDFWINRAHDFESQRPLSTSDCTTMVHKFQTAMQKLTAAYLLSGNTKYADSGIDYMKKLCSWDDIGTSQSGLITAHWSIGMALGFDGFYDRLTAEDKKFIMEAVLRLPYAETQKAYSGKSFEPYWITIDDNFAAVCGGGLLTLSLAFADEDGFDASWMIENVIKTLGVFTSLYFPNGGYYEGRDYSDYALSNLYIGMEALFNSCGTDYGLGSAKGFSEAGSYFPYTQGGGNAINVHDDDRGMFYSEVPFWLAARYGETSYAELAKKQMKQGGKELTLTGYLYCCKAADAYGESNADNMPLDRYFGVSEVGTFRNTFDSLNATFAGIHGGRNGIDHDNLDLGEFVFASDGIPWVIDLGKDSYSLPDYFGSNGYKIYRKKAEGHNLVVINPKQDADTYFGQAANTEVKLDFFKSADKAAMAAYDLTNAYSRDVNSYKRGFYFGDDRNTLLVQDEISLKQTSEFYSFIHTKADINILSNREAEFIQNGKKLHVYVYSNAEDYTLSVMDAKPLPSSPKVDGENDNNGIKKLAIHSENASGNVMTAFKLVPESDFFEAEPVLDSPDKISEWTLPEGEILYHAAISDINLKADRNLTAEIILPKNAQYIELYIDGKSVYKTNVSGVGRQTVSCMVSAYESGEHEAILEVGTTYGIQRASQSFRTFKTQKNTLVSPGYAGGWWDPGVFRWRPYVSSKSEKTVTSTENGFKMSSLDGEGFLSVQIASETADLDKSITKGRYKLDFNLMLTSLDTNVWLECANQSGKWFMNEDKPLLSSGTVINGGSYDINKWYNMSLVIDVDTKKASFYIDDELIFGKGYTNADSLRKTKLCFSGCVAGKEICFGNITAENEYNGSGDDVYIQSTLKKGVYTAKIEGNNSGFNGLPTDESFSKTENGIIFEMDKAQNDSASYSYADDGIFCSSTGWNQVDCSLSGSADSITASENIVYEYCFKSESSVPEMYVNINGGNALKHRIGNIPPGEHKILLKYNCQSDDAEIFLDSTLKWNGTLSEVNKVTLRLFGTTGKTAFITITDASVSVSASMVAAVYKDNKIISLKMFNSLEKEIVLNVPEEAEFVKTFVFKDIKSLEPLCTSSKRTIVYDD